jgi:hypothetical protein
MVRTTSAGSFSWKRTRVAAALPPGGEDLELGRGAIEDERDGERADPEAGPVASTRIR